MITKETMPLHVSSSVKLKRDKSREQLSKCLKIEDKIQNQETLGVHTSTTQEIGNNIENATLVFSTGQGTFKFELSDVLGR